MNTSSAGHGAPMPGAAVNAAQSTLAKRVARSLSGVVPDDSEALAPLRAAFDHVLVRRVGLLRQVVCLLDCERDPRRVCPLGREQLLAVAKRCHDEARLGMRSLDLRILEVGRTASSPDDHARLAPLKKRTGKLFLSAWTLDASAPLWTNSPLGGVFHDGEELERVLVRAGGGAHGSAAARPTERRFPALTAGLLAALLLVFLWQVAQAGWTVDLTPQQLVAEGGVMRVLVTSQHEWWRLFTAPLLHGGVTHIVLNGIALAMAGFFLEPLMGRAWLFALFVIGGLAGSFASMLLNPPHLVSVGASGAIMALFAAGMVLAMRLPKGPSRARVQVRLGQVLIPSLLPLASQAADHTKIDYGAHFGGAIAGVALGFLLYTSWPRERAEPPAARAALGISLAGAALCIVGLVLAHRASPKYRLAAELVPLKDIPPTDAAWRKQENALIAKYPDDPRPRLVRASHAIEAQHFQAAEHDARAALGEKMLLANYFKPGLRLHLKAILALALWGENRIDEARAAARPACGPPAPAVVVRMLRLQGLCETSPH